jgi:hypothetical protein
MVNRVHAVPPMKTAPRQAKDFPPSKRGHSDLCHRKDDMIASKCGRQSERGGNDGTYEQRLCHGESDLSDRQRHAASGDGNKRRAKQAGATVVGPNAGIYRHEKRQGVYRQRENQPAKQTDTKGIEEKAKGEHGGGSIYKGVKVAPSATTAAQV